MYPFKALIFTLFLSLTVNAQPPIVGIESGVGVNLPQTSVTGLPSPAYYLSFQISPIKLGHLSINHNRGWLFGFGKINSAIETSNANIGSNEFKYNTSYTLNSVEGYLNLQHLFKNRKKAIKWIPYLYAGFGQINAVSSAENQTNNNTKTYTQKYFASIYGAMVKIKINHRFDWTIRVALNNTETKYLDGIYYDKKFDAILNLYGGIVYYPWATKKKHYIAWQPYKKICPKSLTY